MLNGTDVPDKAESVASQDNLETKIVCGKIITRHDRIEILYG
jgi:hypothetical protein